MRTRTIVPMPKRMRDSHKSWSHSDKEARYKAGRVVLMKMMLLRTEGLERVVFPA